MSVVLTGNKINLKKIIHGKGGKERIEIPAFLLQFLGDTR
jgi:hypothetical protein